MSSQVFYRKWRPQTLADLVGQEHVTQTLRNALQSDRVAHAYLFCGSRGTGKTSTGRILAKALNCLENEGKGEPCNTCEMCLAIGEGRALDVLEIDAASNRGIDEMRELRERVKFSPASARRKVYIVDEVHMLTDAASNALLKTLEEPPPYVVFVLATTEPHKMLPTILSRCQRFDFRRLAQVAIVSKLMYICAKEGIDIESAGVRLIARSVYGSLRDAENLLEQLVSFYGNQITVHQVEDVLGVSNDSRVKELSRHIVDKDVVNGLATINSVAQDGLDLKQFNRSLVEYLRNLMLVKPGADDALDLAPEDLVEMKELAKEATLPEILRAVKLFAQIDFRFDDYSPLPLELAMVESVLPETVQQIEDMAMPLGKAKKVAPVAEVEVGPPQGDPSLPQEGSTVVVSPDITIPAEPIGVEQDTADDSGAGCTREYIRSHWGEFVQMLRGAGPGANLDAFLRSACEPLEVEGDTLVLGFYYPFHKDRIDTPECRELIESKLGQKFGSPNKVRCILKPKAKQRALDGHLVRAAVEMGARVTNVEETDG